MRSGGKVISHCNLYYGFDFARLLFYSSLSSFMFYSFVVDGGKVSCEDGEQKMKFSGSPLNQLPCWGTTVLASNWSITLPCYWLP
jgi:hypothetical protein